MKQTKIDKLGRIVIPKDHRRILGIDENTRLTVKCESGQIIITTDDKKCEFCGVSINFGAFACDECIGKIKNIIK